MSQTFSPHAYQKRAIKFMIGQACAGLFLDPGLGKTAITLAAFLLLKKQRMARRMLVVAPLRPAQSTWPGELKKWDDFHCLTMAVLNGDDKDELLRSKADVDVVNPEGLKWLLESVQDRREWPWDMLVVDESTKFKHTQTQRFKLLKQMCPKFRRRYILTGSPAPNGLEDLFGQVYVLDGGAALGRFISHYRMNYFNQTGYGGYTWIVKPGGADAIYKKLRPLTLRMAGEDYLELPELSFNRIDVDLPPEAMKAYVQMEKTLVLALESGTITAGNVAAATTKCRQIANGGVYHADGKTWTHIHEAKAEVVVDLVEELEGKPALVAYEYEHDRDRLQKRLGRDVPYIGGGVPARRFQEIEAAWNKGDIPVLLAQPQSVAHGLNLQGTGAAVIFAGETWNLDDRDQLIRRIWRQGQKERVIVHDIIARGTVDEAIMKLLEKKDRTQRALLDALGDHLRGKKNRRLQDEAVADAMNIFGG